MDARKDDVVSHLDYASLGADGARVSGERPSIDIAYVLRTLRRGWRYPLIGLLIGLAAGVACLILVKTPYKSSARILIDRSINRYLQTNKIADQPTLDEMDIGGQVYVLSSDSVVLPVVRSMKLVRDSEFVTQKTDAEQDGDSGGVTDTKSPRERAAVEAVLKRLSVVREDVANVINVSFESVESKKAADIANAIAGTYVAIAAEEKWKSTKIVGRWLQERLIELKRQIADAEHVVQEYKAANNLLDDGVGTPSPELLSNLKIQLANARVAAAEAKDRLERIRGMGEGGTMAAMSADALLNPTRASVISFALTNTDLVGLRAKYRDLEARAAEVESRVGPNHAAYIKLHDRLDVLRADIQTEEQRIADAYVNEYQIAKAREGKLAASVTRLSGETGTSSQLRELESAADALRNLYNNLLQKYKEMDGTQAETLPIQSARIITRAAPPLYKSSRKILALFAGCLVGGLLLGSGAAVGREWAADVFRTPRAVEQATEIGCVALPLVESKSAAIEEYFLAAPYSRFAEGLRRIKASIDGAHSRGSAKVIGVVSSVPDEGKTVVTANLAALMVASSGARALVIDSDLHRRKLSDALAPGAREGLIEALHDPSRLPAIVAKRKDSGLDVLPCGSTCRVPNAAELLGSADMERLLAAARQSYDYIIIEIAPIMSVVDVKTIERFIDGFVFIVEWGETKRTAVLDAMSDGHVIRDRISTVVLNKIDPVALRGIESYKRAKSEEYYQA